MKNIFKRLLNVKGMVVEDVSIDDSPLRDAPVLVARVRCRKAALRCSRCGRKYARNTTTGAAKGVSGTRTSAAIGSSSWVRLRVWNAVCMAWRCRGFRGRSRAAGSRATSSWNARG